MSKYKWHQSSVGEFIDFNPSESLPKNKIAKKVPMEKLGVFERKIKGFEYAEYKGGPKFRNGDTLVAKITPCLENGKTAFVDILNDNEVAYGSSEFIVLRENEWSDKKFIYYLARSPLFRERAISCMEGTSGRKRVNEGALKRQRILVPELKDQRRIAAVLSAFDDKIELNNKINVELEQMAKTLYDYWFVQFDFPNAKGKPYKSSGGKMVYNDVLKREVPEGWEVEKLGAVLKTYLGGTPSTANVNFWDGNIPWMNSGEVANFPVLATEQAITEEAIKNSSTKLMKEGSVLLSITRHLRVNILGIDACINQSIAGIEENELFKNSYIYFSILNDIERLMSLRTGAQQPHINKEIVDSSPFIVADRKVLEMYYKAANPIRDRIVNNAKQNQQLSALRDWLLPMLMNGQAKVAESYTQQKEPLSIVAESEPECKKQTELNIPNGKKGFAKQVLAGRIISLFKEDPQFTEIKFQKIQFLAEHIIQADLNLNYYYQAAGPYDNVFMHSIYNDLKKNKWYDSKDKKFIALEKQAKIEEYYQGYFGSVIGQLDKLFHLLSGATEVKSEIIATIYAVWNNFIIEGRPITEDELIQSFYNWSERKHQYTRAQVQEGLQWLRENKLEPTGFGKLIKKAKSKK
ncbi:restriction endonuclease subunit S [Pseudoflavitalea rhizosphaerae]|uniref:restriction endonuclease subunit S n=1 Tax=Pseudoflavitalea rhizosphaerae TaxID=1884793 RepID=UPI000F8E7A60|nr:restriction endonuclease subunit S [Pseudoflavitalea rhizosphaerae]